MCATRVLKARSGGSGLSEADAGDWPKLAAALEASSVSSIADFHQLLTARLDFATIRMLDAPRPLRVDAGLARIVDGALRR